MFDQMKRLAVGVTAPALAGMSLVAAAGAMSAAAAQDAASASVDLPVASAEDIDAAADPANWRQVPAEDLLVLATTKGEILVEMAPEFAPKHVARIKELARQEFYDGLTFHRVIDGFMAQGGDPLGTGTGGSGQNIEGEFVTDRGEDWPVVETGARRLWRTGFSFGMPVVTQPDAVRIMMPDEKVAIWVAHCAGVASMARSTDPDSADSQFFLMREMTESLDKKYSGWGRVVAGLDVVRGLEEGTVGQSLGFEPDQINRMRVAADLPAGERPTVWVEREDGPAFAARVAALETAPDACDIQLASVVARP